MYGILYKLTNEINGKSYIGKTYDTLENRIIGHLYDAKKDRCKNRPIYRAINKYGAEKFLVTVLGYFSEEILEEKEIEFIELYNTYKKGYNATLGGDSKRRLNFSNQDIKEAVERTDSTTAASRYLEIDFSTLKKYAQKFNIALKNLIIL